MQSFADKKKFLFEQYSAFLRDCKREIRCIDTPEARNFLREFVPLIRPWDIRGQRKIRVGGNGDGGYVMLPPAACRLAYSFGVSTHSPWDLDMANRNCKVFQYDGSVAQGPDAHSNISFYPYFVSGLESPPPNAKNLEQILRDHGHLHKTLPNLPSSVFPSTLPAEALRILERGPDIILQIDIEGGEWEFFSHLSAERMRQFPQIVVEFHDLGYDYDKLAVLKKICETHVPIHFHYNICVPFLEYIQSLFFIYNSKAFEVTYVRKDNELFTKNMDYFPTELDFSNSPGESDIPIGFFDLIQGALG